VARTKAERISSRSPSGTDCSAPATRRRTARSSVRSGSHSCAPNPASAYGRDSPPEGPPRLRRSLAVSVRRVKKAVPAISGETASSPAGSTRPAPSVHGQSDLQHPHQKRRERLDAQRARAHAVQHLTDRRPRQPRSEQSLGNAFELRGRAQQNPDEVVPLGVPETLGGLGQPLAGGDGYGGAGGAIHAPTRRIHGERDRPRGIVPQPIAQGGGKERFRFDAGSAAPACWGPDKIRGE